MTSGTVSLLSPGERTVLARLADIIAPRWNALPSASDIDLSHGPIDRALRARPDLVEPLRQLLGQMRVQEGAMAIEHLQRERPAQFAVLMQAIAGAYYMNESVRAALRYGGQRRLTATDATER
jgi:hypothetical protein